MNTIATVKLRGTIYPAVEAGSLENGMIYFDGAEISGVERSGKSVKFTLTLGRSTVSVVKRATSLIALAEEQVAVFI